MTEESDSLSGFKLGKNGHNHKVFSSGEIIRNTMIRKGLKRARESMVDTIPKILKELEFEFLTIENSASVDWSNKAVSQILYRERRKSFPSIPKELKQYNSSMGFNTMKSGGNLNLK